MTRRYPLEPVLRVRADSADQQARALGDALRTVEAAEVTARRRAEAEEAHARARSEVLVSEQSLLEEGHLNAGDLAHRGAWAAAVDAAQVELLRLRNDAAAALSAARGGAEAQRQKLQLAEAEAKVIEKHREAFQTREARDALAREEENAEEVHLGRRARERKA